MGEGYIKFGRKITNTSYNISQNVYLRSTWTPGVLIRVKLFSLGFVPLLALNQGQMLVHLCLSVLLTVISLTVSIYTVTYELMNDDDDDDEIMAIDACA